MANNQLLASDNFSSGSLAAGWAAASGSNLSILSAGPPYYAEPPSTALVSDNIWTGLVWPNDQTSELTVQTLSNADTNTTIALWVRMQSGALSGYAANFNNQFSGVGQVQIYKCAAGSFSTLGSSVTLRVVAGDVISFQAAGSILSLYVNSNRIAWYFDATYPSGSPGFRQQAATNITHCQVASWRGYSAVQQDGVWTKKGTVIPALAGDLAATGSSGVYQLSNLFYEGNAQLLAGTVFKGWFTGGTSPGNIYYAESTDGISWTRSGSPVLASYANPFLIKVAGTFYMYVQAAASQGSGAIALYTSTDGITWSQQSTTILSAGTGSDWDAQGFFDFQPVTISAGTWYALYTGTASGGNNLSTGLATSSDGLTWSKHSSVTPVLANVTNCGAIAQVGSTWHAWFGANQPGQFSGAYSQFRPFEVVRYKTTDFVTWTKDVHSAHRTQMYESLNYNLAGCGGAFPNSIIDVNGKAYLYIQENPTDGVNPDIQQISLAIAPTNIANLVTVSEDAVQQVATDNFTNGAGDLSANWATPTGFTKLKIIAGNLVEATATSTPCGMRYTGSSFGNEQYSEITINALTSTGIVEPTVRMQASGDCYELLVHGATNVLQSSFQVFKFVGGVSTAIGPAVGFTPQVNDVYRLAVTNGSDGNPIISAFQNSFIILQVEDYSNAIPSGGAPGMIAFGSSALTDAQISLWAGGNADTPPSGLVTTTHQQLRNWRNG